MTRPLLESFELLRRIQVIDFAAAGVSEYGAVRIDREYRWICRDPDRVDEIVRTRENRPLETVFRRKITRGRLAT